MTHVVTEECVGCKHTDCVAVCPCDSFREGPDRLVIDPDSCIDCGACLPECPAEAIYPDQDLPPGWQATIELNAVRAKEWPLITEKR